MKGSLVQNACSLWRTFFCSNVFLMCFASLVWQFVFEALHQVLCVKLLCNLIWACLFCYNYLLCTATFVLGAAAAGRIVPRQGCGGGRHWARRRQEGYPDRDAIGKQWLAQTQTQNQNIELLSDAKSKQIKQHCAYLC